MSSTITKKITLAILFALITITVQGQIIMSGTVKTDKGVSLVGAYINVEGTKIATLTDLDGNYTLTVPQEYEDYDVSINYAGYLAETIKASSGRADIVLKYRETQEIAAMYVSTQKRLQRNIDVPITLSVLDSSRIRQSAIYSIEDVAQTVPGFVISAPSVQYPVYSIRGVASDEPYSYGQSRISVFMDGVSISRMQASFLDHYDMERVEVSKGPQGTLYGRGAEIGAVEFIRNKPTDEFGVDIAMLYGNYNQRKVVGVLNTPAGKSFANRLAFQYNAYDGIIKNNTGGRLNGKNTIAVRNSSTFHFGSKTDLNLVFDMQNDDAPGYAYLSKTRFNRNGEIIETDRSPFDDAFLTHGDDELYFKRKTGGVLMHLDSELGDHFKLSSITGLRAYDSKESFDADGTLINIIEGGQYAKGQQVSQELRLDWQSANNKLNGFVGASYFYEKTQHSYKLRGNFHYIYANVVGKSMRASLASMPESIINGIQNGITGLINMGKEKYADYSTQMDELCVKLNNMIAERIKTRMDQQFSQWFDVISWDKTPDFYNDTRNLVSNVMLETLTELVESDEFAKNMVGALSGGSIEGLVSKFDIGESISNLKAYSCAELTNNHFEEEVDYNRNHEASVFADFTWNFAPKFYLTLGIRGTYETVYTGYYSGSDAAPILGSIIYTNTKGETVWTDHNNYKSWVGRAVLNYMVDTTHNIFLSVSKGRRPGMVYFDFKPDKVINLSPEMTYNYELGIKGISRYGHFSYTAAVYYFDWKHFQTVIAGLGTSENGALSYIYDDNGLAYGVGAEFSGVYAFNPNVGVFADFTYCGGHFGDKDMNGKAQDNAGNQFAMMPQFMYDMGFNWRHALPGNKCIYFYPSFYTQSKVFFDDSNTPEYTQGAYIIFNANAGFQWTKRHITYDVGISGRNITNTQYLIDGGNVGEVVGMPTYSTGRPAMFYLSFRMHIK
ncbi:MAG: TonB-dependent receptor [Bacteroidales bacterium]|nr:TonB-dependent receptor [Bacteroidales bacterium]